MWIKDHNNQNTFTVLEVSNFTTFDQKKSKNKKALAGFELGTYHTNYLCESTKLNRFHVEYFPLILYTNKHSIQYSL